MGLLHSERWREMAPEFESSKLLAQCEALLAVDDQSSTMAMALVHVREALATLHPATRNPEARTEYEQRVKGAYGEAAAAKRAGDERDATIAKLQARIDALEHPSQPDNG
jgi:uncharacterized membrane protein YccC